MIRLNAMSKHWFLIQFKPNAHSMAARNLNRQGFETFLPMQEITKRKASRFVNQLRPLFPGYMFVCFDIATAPWHNINSTMGVSRLVRFDASPNPLPPALMAGLMLRCDHNGKLLSPMQLKHGDDVEVMTGPFANFIATIESIDAEQRVWVLLDILGQKTRMQVDPKHLQPAK